MRRDSVNNLHLRGADEVAVAVQPILALELSPERREVVTHVVPRQTLHIHYLHVWSVIDVLI